MAATPNPPLPSTGSGQCPNPETSTTDPAVDEATAQAHKDVILRLKNIEGHVRGIQRMVEGGTYCIDVMKQVKAVKQALDRVSAITLETHLRTCVTDGLRSDEVKTRERVIDEIVEVFSAARKL